MRPRKVETQLTEPLAPTTAAPLNLDQTFKVAKEAWLGAFERDYLAALLARHAGNLSQAAREAEVDRKHFRRLARKYNLLAARPEDDAEDDD